MVGAKRARVKRSMVTASEGVRVKRVARVTRVKTCEKGHESQEGQVKRVGIEKEARALVLRRALASSVLVERVCDESECGGSGSSVEVERARESRPQQKGPPPNARDLRGSLQRPLLCGRGAARRTLRNGERVGSGERGS